MPGFRDNTKVSEEISTYVSIYLVCRIFLSYQSHDRQ